MQGLLIPIPEAARRIGYSEKTLRELVYAGRISYRRVTPRSQIFFTEDDLAQFVVSLKVPAGQSADR